VQDTKTGKNIPNDHKIYGCQIDQMAIKYVNAFNYIKGPPKFTQIGIFGLKIYHLATLHLT
jgi:hypothetical protein